MINNWYAATDAAALDDGPVRVRMLGLDFVLFRDARGTIACLSDVCCHRGSSLSRGTLNGDGVRCPYHGWTYDRRGRCRQIPSLKNGARIPKRARVPSYPTVEKYGLVWAFLGDLSGKERPDLPNIFPEFDEHGSWHISLVKKDWPVNWERMCENFLDTSHIFAVHQFASFLSPDIETNVLDDGKWSGKVEHLFKSAQNSDPDNGAYVTMEYSLVGAVTRNRQQMPGIGDQIIWYASTPTDIGTTRVHAYFAHDTSTSHEQHNSLVEQIVEQVIGEDERALNILQPIVPPESNSEELLVAADSVEATFRKKSRQAAREWGVVDHRALEQQRGERVFVMLSPEHRSDPDNWVHKTVPIRCGEGP